MLCVAVRTQGRHWLGTGCMSRIRSSLFGKGWAIVRHFDQFARGFYLFYLFLG